MSPQRFFAASSAVLSSLVLISVAQAQGEDVKRQPIDAGVSKAELNAQKENLRDRNRGSMHPGDPLLIVGIEQGDNEIRSRTPALVGAERPKVIVDDDAAYKRKLALFESGGHTMQPTTITRPTPPPARAIREVPGTAVEDAPAKKSPLLALIVGGVTSILCCGWLFRRYGALIGRAEA